MAEKRDRRPTRAARPQPKDETRPTETKRGGMPGDGVGRRDEVGVTGVHPFGDPKAPDDAPIRPPGAWGRAGELDASEIGKGD